jgi:hypothetical protein
LEAPAAQAGGVRYKRLVRSKCKSFFFPRNPAGLSALPYKNDASSKLRCWGLIAQFTDTVLQEHIVAYTRA